MNKKMIYKYIAASLGFLFLTCSAYATACTPVLVLIRHAEDAKGKLDIYGQLHQKAYAPVFAGVKNKLDVLLNEEICPFTKVISLYIQPIRQLQQFKQLKILINHYPLTIQIKTIEEGQPPSLVGIPLLASDESTLLIMNRQTIWAD